MAGNGSYQKMEDEPEFGVHGLTTEQAAAQQKKWGKNEIPEEKEPVSALLCLEWLQPPLRPRSQPLRSGFRGGLAREEAY